jgi:two-component system, response regulator PdtaR
MGTSRPAALIVEDQPFLGLVASDILRESGFDTFHAYDAEDAAALLEKHPEIEVVVTGAELPGAVGGIELCHKVSRERPGVQLVVTTAGNDPVPSDMPPGARVLHKPYSSGELRTLVAPRSLLQDA